jgi:hypothetical protein
MQYIRINSDDWADAGQIYALDFYARREDSSACEIRYFKDNKPVVRVVPFHWIEFLEEND